MEKFGPVESAHTRTVFSVVARGGAVMTTSLVGPAGICRHYFLHNFGRIGKSKLPGICREDEAFPREF